MKIPIKTPSRCHESSWKHMKVILYTSMNVPHKSHERSRKPHESTMKAQENPSKSVKVRWKPKESPWKHGSAMKALWMRRNCRGSGHESLWKQHENTAKAHESPSMSMKAPQKPIHFHESPMKSPRKPHGSIMQVLWMHHDIALKSTWKSMKHRKSTLKAPSNYIEDTTKPHQSAMTAPLKPINGPRKPIHLRKKPHGSPTKAPWMSYESVMKIQWKPPFRQNDRTMKVHENTMKESPTKTPEKIHEFVWLIAPWKRHESHTGQWKTYESPIKASSTHHQNSIKAPPKPIKTASKHHESTRNRLNSKRKAHVSPCSPWNYMKASWTPHDSPMKAPWKHYKIQWKSHESTNKALWKRHESMRKFHENPRRKA